MPLLEPLESRRLLAGFGFDTGDTRQTHVRVGVDKTHVNEEAEESFTLTFTRADFGDPYEDDAVGSVDDATPFDQSLSFAISYSGTAERADFDGLPDSLEFGPNEGVLTYTVTVVDDASTDDEHLGGDPEDRWGTPATETLNIIVEDGGGYLGSASGVVVEDGTGWHYDHEWSLHWLPPYEAPVPRATDGNTSVYLGTGWSALPDRYGVSPDFGEPASVSFSFTSGTSTLYGVGANAGFSLANLGPSIGVSVEASRGSTSGEGVGHSFTRGGGDGDENARYFLTVAVQAVSYVHVVETKTPEGDDAVMLRYVKLGDVSIFSPYEVYRLERHWVDPDAGYLPYQPQKPLGEDVQHRFMRPHGLAPPVEKDFHEVPDGSWDGTWGGLGPFSDSSIFDEEEDE